MTRAWLRRALLAWGLAVAAAATPSVGPARALEADGLSIERAIVIDASTTTAGISAEYAYLRRVYPGWQRTRQALIERGGRRYDILTIVSPSNETREIVFDVTKFFGRM